MAKYYYEKWSLDKRWSEDPNNPQPYLQKKTINTAQDVMGTWFSSSGHVIVSGEPRKNYSQTNNGEYLKFPSGSYYDMLRIEQIGELARVGDMGYYWKEEEPYDPNIYVLYKVQITKVPEYAMEKYEGELLGWWYVTKKRTYIDIYQHIYGKNNLLETFVAEDGEYPDDGQMGDYWYVKKKIVFPELKVKVDGEIKTGEMGWVKIDGQLKEIDKIWIKVDGVLKEI